MSTPRPEDVSFGRGADRRLSRAVLDAGRAALRAPQGSPRARMLDDLRTVAAGIAAALVATRGTAPEESKARKRKATTALLVACGGLERAIRAIAPGERRPARRLDKADADADESAA